MSTESADPPTKERKLFFRAIWRVLAIFCLLSSLLLIPVCQRDRALDRITELGGTIQSPRSWVTAKIPDSWHRPLKEHFMPYADIVFGKGWVRRLENTSTVNLREAQVSDDDLKVISNLTSVKYLIMSGGTVSAEGLAHLARMKELNNLGLSNMDMTDGQLATLEAFPELRSLFLPNTGISDTELAQIRNLQALKVLQLSNNELLTGSGLEDFQWAEKLTYLSLSNTGITDDALENLKNFPNLKSLILGDTQISDAGLVHIKKLSQLSTLYLEGTEVTQEGISTLEGLPIRILTLPKKNDFFVPELKRLFPGCHPSIR